MGNSLILGMVITAIGLPQSPKMQAEPAVQTILLSYMTKIGPIPKGQGPIDVFVPLAPNDQRQKVLSYKVTASIPGREGTEHRYGNRFWHGHQNLSDGQTISVRVDYRIRRRAFLGKLRGSGAPRPYTSEEKEQYAKYVAPNKRVPVSGPLVRSLVQKIAPDETSLLKIARATYDYVVDHMEYKKVGTGWGNGDTFWACSEKYGNCTDFHALFTSLARARGIPSRFEIGLPVSLHEPKGTVSGYHCWVEFYLPGTGWLPIDASEAKKHPKKRNTFFAAQPADRIKLSVGRDLNLGEGHRTGPLNYFVYPHIEVGAKRYHKQEKYFSYQLLPTPHKAAPSNEGALRD